MPAIDFEHAFKVLQLSPGATFDEIKKTYENLVSQRPQAHTNLRKNNENYTLQQIAEAYNDLQLLVKPYELLRGAEQIAFLAALDEMPEGKLQFFLELYPHTSLQFHWDSKTYPRLASYLYTTKATKVMSSVGSLFALFTSCHTSASIADYDNEEADIELPQWQKKNQ